MQKYIESLFDIEIDIVCNYLKPVITVFEDLNSLTIKLEVNSCSTIYMFSKTENIWILYLIALTQLLPS